MAADSNIYLCKIEVASKNKHVVTPYAYASIGIKILMGDDVEVQPVPL